MTGPGRTTTTTKHPRPGVREALSAAEALEATLRQAGAVVTSTHPPSADGRPRPADAAFGTALGRASSGERSALIVGGAELAEVSHALSRAADGHIPLVVHHRCRADGATGQTGHGAYFSLRDSGCFQLFAATAQEILDLALISHRIAEESLLPGICSQDAFGSRNELFTLRLPDEQVVVELLGNENDSVDSPTPSQRLLFGDSRRRVPRLLNLDRPVGVGAHLDASAETRALAGQDVFFFDHVAGIARQAFRDFGRLTGRNYQPVSGYRVDDADYVIVAQGAISDPLRTAVDELRSRGRKVGLVIIRMLRPFPGADLCDILKGKKKVTVVESVQRGFAENPPLIAEIRASLDRAAENGHSDRDTQPYPDYPRIERPAGRPALFSAICTSGGETAIGDMVLLAENMLPGGAGMREFHVGVSFSQPSSRIPVLERLSQLLESAYAGIGKLGLTSGRARDLDRSGSALVIHGSADQNLDTVATVLGRSIFDQTSWSVCGTLTRGVGEHRFEPLGWQIRHSFDVDDAPPAAIQNRLVVALQHHVLADTRLLDSTAPSGIVLLDAPDDGVLELLPHRSLRIMRERDVRFRRVDAETIAGSLSEDRWIRRQLAAHAVAGAAIASYPPLADIDTASLISAYGRNLRERWPVDDALLDQCLQAFENGAGSVSDVAVPLPDAQGADVVEPSAPWTVREAPVHTDTVFDSGRFWNSVGYLYETGRREESLSDPFVAAGLVPARTSSFRSWQPYRTEIPSFLPENCTACGACFVACPDAAIPATVTDVTTLVETALLEAEAASEPLLQVRRIQKHLVKQAYRLFAGDARHQYRTAGGLLTAAFDELVNRLGQSDEQTDLLRSEVETLANVVRSYPLARTETFFAESEEHERGTGLIFSININPDSCKACGICSNICPDNALEIVNPSQERLDQYRRDWKFAASLGSASAETIDRFATADRPDSLAYRLLDRRSYHSMVGGDSSFPGSGTQSTLHLIAAMADAVVRPRVRRFVAAMSDCAEALEQKIKAQLRESVDINDFEQFGRRLGSLTDRTLRPETLASIAAGDASVDRGRLEQYNDALLGLRGLIRDYDGSDTGTERSTTMGVFAERHSATNRGYYPYNPFSFPWINTVADSVAVADGMFSAASDVILSALRVLRRARLVLDDVYEPAEHDALLDTMTWRDLTDEEWAICPPVCVIAGDDNEAISSLLGVEVPVKVFLLSSDITFSGSASDLRLWPLARPDLYVLRSTIGMRGHLLAGLTEGIKRRGPALFHLYVAEPSEHGFDPAESMNRMRMASESRGFPLMKYNPDAPGEWSHRWSLDGNPSPGQDWATRGGPGGDAPLTLATWAVGEGRFRHLFRHVPKGRWTARMRPLHEFMETAADEREDLEPYIDLPQETGSSSRVVVLPKMVDLVERSRAEWQLLQEFAGVRSSVVSKVTEELRARFDDELSGVRESLRADYEARAERSRRQEGAEFHARLTDELLALSGFGADSAAAATRLSEYLSGPAEGSPDRSAETDEDSSTNGSE